MLLKLMPLCRLALLGLVTASFCLLTNAGEGGSDLPKIIVFRDSHYGWVSADMLKIEDQKIVMKDSGQTLYEFFNNAPVLHPDRLVSELLALEKRRGRMKKNPDCIELVRVNEFVPPTSFQEIFEKGPVFCFIGQMGQLKAGVTFADFPAGALEVSLRKTIVPRESETIFYKDRFYIHYPNIHFEIDGVPFCSQGAFFDFGVQSGARLLAFVNNSYDADGTYFRINPQYVFTETEDGALVKPRTLVEDPALDGINTLDELFEFASRLINPAEKGEKAGREQ